MNVDSLKKSLTKLAMGGALLFAVAGISNGVGASLHSGQLELSKFSGIGEAAAQVATGGIQKPGMNGNFLKTSNPDIKKTSFSLGNNKIDVSMLNSSPQDLSKMATAFKNEMSNHNGSINSSQAHEYSAYAGALSHLLKTHGKSVEANQVGAAVTTFVENKFGDFNVGKSFNDGFVKIKNVQSTFNVALQSGGGFGKGPGHM